MGIPFIVGLVLAGCTIIWIYMLFITSSVKASNDDSLDLSEGDVVERCKQLYEKGMWAELQRYAQRELAKDYGNVELRRILAQSFMASGNTQLAIMHYEAILSVAPFDVKTRELLADYYCDNGPISRAVELYEQIFTYEPGNIAAVEALSDLYERENRLQKAVEMYEMLASAEFEEERLKELEYKLADLYSKTQNYEKAFDIYRKIHSREPENLELTAILQDLAYKNKYWEDCLKYCKEIIENVGDDFEIWEKIAQLYTFLENWDKAIETYKKILSLEDSTNPHFLYHQNELCNAMIKNKQYSEAIDKLKDLQIENPTETSFLFTLAQAYTSIGEYQTGVNLYNRLLDELPPDQSEMIINYISNLICIWAQDLFQQGEYNKAFDKFFEALKYNEENDEVYYHLGRCNYYIKSFQDSIAHFKRAITIKPSESRYYFGLGCAYDESGSIKNAKIAFYDAIDLDPTNVPARIAYAISLTKELEYAKSIEQFIEVLKYTPNDSDTLYNLALAYELVGDDERAIKFYKEAIKCDKKHKEARHNLRLLLGESYNESEYDEYVDEDIVVSPQESDENNNEQYQENEYIQNDDVIEVEQEIPEGNSFFDEGGSMFQ